MKLLREKEDSRLYRDETGNIKIERTAAGEVRIAEQHRRGSAWRLEYFREKLKALTDDDLYDLDDEHCISYETISRTERTILIEWAGSRMRLKLDKFKDGRLYRYPHAFEWGWRVRPKLVERIAELVREVTKLTERIEYWSQQPQDEWHTEFDGRSHNESL